MKADLVHRLRDRAYASAYKAPDPLVEEAAAEIERLRLTDEERQAIATAARIAGAVGESDIKATLKSFLKRLPSSPPISGAGQSTETGKK